MITVNGTTHSFVAEQTLGDLLCKLDVENQICAIEVNKVLIPYKERSEYEIQEEDNIEIVSIVGGG